MNKELNEFLKKSLSNNINEPKIRFNRRLLKNIFFRKFKDFLDDKILELETLNEFVDLMSDDKINEIMTNHHKQHYKKLNDGKEWTNILN